MNSTLNSQNYIAKGNAPWFSNNWLDINKVISMNKLDSGTTVVCDGSVTDMTEMFRNCNELTSIDLSNFDASNVVYMSGMFYYCFRITALDLSNFDTSKVKDMGYMFYNCSNLTKLDLSSFDTSNVTEMSVMFSNCYELTTLDLSNFDTSNVKYMEGMFYNCTRLTTIKGVIDMKSCNDFNDMFKRCTKLKDVKIKNPPPDFEIISGLSKSQYTIVS